MYTKKEIILQMLKIGIPVALQNFINVLVSMLDTLMIGNVGEAQLGAVNQVNSVYVFYTMFIWGICMGTVVITARYWGKGETEPIRDMIGLAMRISMIAAVLLSVFIEMFPYEVMRFLAKDPEVIEYGVQYIRVFGWFYILPAITVTFLSNLRAIGDVKVSVAVYSISCLTNLVLNWVFIYGNLGAPRLEVRGAALATVISKTIECVLVLIYMYKIENKINFRMKYIFADVKRFVPSFLKFGIPVFLSEFIWGLGQTVQASTLGQYSKEFLAAFSLVMVILDLSTVAMCGFANASMILMGNMIGAGRDVEAKKWSKFFAVGGICVGVFMAAVVMIIRPFAPNFIVCGEETKNYILTILLICAYIDVCYGASWNLGSGILRSGGNTGLLAKIDVGFTIFFKIVLGTFLGRILQIEPVLLMLIICSDDLVKGLAYLTIYIKGNWLKHGMTVKEDEEIEEAIEAEAL